MNTEEKIKEIVKETLSLREEIKLDDNLRTDLRADELDIIEVAMGIEEEFGIEVSDDIMDEVETVGDLLKYVEENKK